VVTAALGLEYGPAALAFKLVALTRPHLNIWALAETDLPSFLGMARRMADGDLTSM
jgi:hypothetical protein